MFKKTLSIFLCIVMCLSFFSVSAVETLAAYNARSLFSVKGEAIEDDLLKYSINVTKEQKNIGGIILEVHYDSTVLKPVKCAPAERTTSTEGTVKNFEGEYAHGVNKNNPDIYNIAYMNSVSVSTTEALAFFNLEFEVIDESRPSTDIKFYCKEYYSTTETDKNITVADGLQLIAEFLDVSTLAKPVLKEVVPCAEGLKFSWKPVEGAVGYQILRASSATSWEPAGTVGADITEYVDEFLTSGTIYTYTVRAFNNYGVSLYDAIGVSCKYIEKPVITSLENSYGGVTIEWSETAGASHYIILRRVVGETEWKQLIKRRASEVRVFEDETVVDGIAYEYDVNSAAESFNSVTSEKGETIKYIAAPEFGKFSNTIKGIKIEWEAHPNAIDYVIYRRERGVNAELVAYASSSKNSYVDENVTPGKTYFYSIQVCTNDGDSAYDTIGVSITRVPSIEVSSLSLEKNGIKVEWNGISGATGYAIYRRSTNETGWKPVGVVSENEASFVDTKVESGAEYVYAVCPKISASEGAKVESDPIYFIKAPGNTVAKNIKAGISVTWDLVKGASRYEVMRMDLSGAFVKVADVDSTETLEYLDTNVEWEESYVYAVKAFSIKGESLLGDSTSTIQRLGALGIATPEISDGGIKVTWEPHNRADAYAVYRNNGGEWVRVSTVTDAEYLDKNVHSTFVYAYAVAVIINDSEGVLDTDNAPTLKYIAPPKTITVTNSADFSTISWSAVDGAVKYEIHRVEDAENAVSALIGAVDGATLSYVDRDVTPGKTYKYFIRTIDDEKKSAMSEGAKNTFLAIPQLKSVSNAFEGVTITWNSVAGAEKYNVYRKVYGGNWVLITAVSAEDALTYTDTGATDGKLIYYTVRAVNDKSMSTYVAKGTTYIAAPKLSYSNSASGIYMKWDKNPNAVSYWVYRKAANAKYWTKVAEVTNNYYTDKNVKSGTDYTYTVRAYNGKILSGYYSPGWKTKYLSVPQLSSVANGYGAITFSWKAVTGAKGYYVYRKADGAKSWTYVGYTTANSYRDTNVKNKSTYTYTVRAINGSDLSYYNTAGKAIKYVTAPTLTVANRTEGVQLTWNAVPGASSYYIYRKALKETTWTKIATVTKTSYMDTKVVNGANYKYTIRAYSSKTLSGYYVPGWSTVFLATPKLVSATSYQSGIYIKWQPVKWATGYFIFRKTGNGNWVQIGTVKGSNTVTYADKTAQMGEKYTYTVRAYYSSYRSWFQPGLTCIDKY